MTDTLLWFQQCLWLAVTEDSGHGREYVSGQLYKPAGKS